MQNLPLAGVEFIDLYLKIFINTKLKDGMKKIIGFLLITVILVPVTLKSQDNNMMEEANDLAHKLMIIDTHIDVPERLKQRWEDISEKTEHGITKKRNTCSEKTDLRRSSAS